MVEDNLSSESITDNLGTSHIGREVFCYKRLTSTNDVAIEAAKQGAVGGTVILADEQTVGRGRIKRKWLSPGGSIALSVILYPDIEYLPSLIMLASLSVVYSVQAATGLKPEVKWPNDVLLKGKKICGILIESDLWRDRVNYVVIGIGINVNVRLADFPEISQTATNLSDELGRTVSRQEIIRHLLVEMDKLYLTLQSGGSIYEAWRDNLMVLGRHVYITGGKNRYEGTAESVARDGSLWLRQADGKLVRIVAGDVTIRY